MEIAGNLLNADDNERLKAWREAHFYSIEGIRADPALPPYHFRTLGNVLFLASDFYRRCFGDRGAVRASLPASAVQARGSAMLAIQIAVNGQLLRTIGIGKEKGASLERKRRHH